MSWSWRREVLLFAPLMAMFVASAVAWPFADDSIAVHWNISGEVDRYGGKFEVLMLLPLVATGVALLLAFVPRIDPARMNYASFGGVYDQVRVAVLLFLAGLHALLIATALGADVDVARVIALAMGVLFLLLGNVLPKFRPNYFAGIRTPWTLSSARSWTATHRLGGRIFLAIGVGFLVMAVVQQPWFLIALLVATFASTGWLMWYSYRVWRDDPDRTTATQTRPADDEPPAQDARPGRRGGDPARAPLEGCAALDQSGGGTRPVAPAEASLSAESAATRRRRRRRRQSTIPPASEPE